MRTPAIAAMVATLLCGLSAAAQAPGGTACFHPTRHSARVQKPGKFVGHGDGSFCEGQRHARCGDSGKWRSPPVTHRYYSHSFSCRESPLEL